jgi:polyvinyl alcohol dehydrogenase (cytochrome)
MNLARVTLVTFCLAAIAVGIVFTPVRAQIAADWAMGGQNLFNTRNQPLETAINAQNVSTLVQKWVFTTGGDVTATPAVVGGAVYVPDWAGNFYKIDAITGQLLWSRKTADYTGRSLTYSRTYPAVDGNVVYIGTQSGNIGEIKSHPSLIAINTATGDANWVTEIDNQPAAVMTQAPVVYNGVVYVGVSSLEEFVAINPTYACCVFRGNFVAVNAATGAILWRTYMVPDNHGRPDGYSGAPIWSSTPVIDAARRTVYVATGNNYKVAGPDQKCMAAGGGVSCTSPDNHFDSVLALDLDSGQIKWAVGVSEFDAFTIACITPLRANCPSPTGQDADFGSGPNLFSVTIQGQTRQLLGVGEKSGVYWALDPDTGKIVWATRTGPTGMLGGILWGTAVDGQRVYITNANFGRVNWQLSNGQTTNGGFWTALDAATGQILWQTADPGKALDMAPVTVANGVVYVASVGETGRFSALDAASGQILWGFASGGSVIAGPAVVNGMVYWGSGYGRWGMKSNNKLYAFGLPSS